MTGTVLRVDSKSGLIKDESGRILFFSRAAVLDPGFDCLDSGHPVTFNVDSENRRVAVEVLRHFEGGTDNPPLEDGGAPPKLRYLGYEQEGSVRRYKFVAVSPQGRSVTFMMGADLGLLAEHHIRIQDAPELCLRALEAELTPEDWAAPNPLRHVLTTLHLTSLKQR